MSYPPLKNLTLQVLAEKVWDNLSGYFRPGLDHIDRTSGVATTLAVLTQAYLEGWRAGRKHEKDETKK